MQTRLMSPELTFIVHTLSRTTHTNATTATLQEVRRIMYTNSKRSLEKTTTTTTTMMWLHNQIIYFDNVETWMIHSERNENSNNNSKKRIKNDTRCPFRCVLFIPAQSYWTQHKLTEFRIKMLMRVHACVYSFFFF